MESERRIDSPLSIEELAGPLDMLPPVEFCCVYGSSLLPNTNNNKDNKTTMVDYILGVSDPLQWHAENLERNRHHYSSLISQFGPRAITSVAEGIGVGVHFNPFVNWKDKMIKYGVVRMQDLAWDILTWEKFYLSGRLQKPVHALVDYWDLNKVNMLNLKAATNCALILLPSEFSEEDLYAKICSLSYMGDLRMLFAEDKNKVRNIVQGSFRSFQKMYEPFLQDLIAAGVLRISSCSNQSRFEQETDVSATNSLFSTLPSVIQRQMSAKRGIDLAEAGGAVPQVTISSREEAANCCRKALRRAVRTSSLKQAVSGFLATGGVNAASYLARKMSKAWNSRAS